MPLWQVVEKADYATDWSLVRYHAAAASRYDTKEEALSVARDYVTEQNVNNALAAGEKESGAEAFMMTDTGAFLGVLDGKDWYVKDRHGEILTADNKNERYRLEGKTEVAVREVPGT